MATTPQLQQGYDNLALRIMVWEAWGRVGADRKWSVRHCLLRPYRRNSTYGFVDTGKVDLGTK